MNIKFEHNSFMKRLSSMLKVDFRRMLTMQLFYIMLGVSLVIPVLILVMTTMMDGTVSVNPTTGVETVMEGFDNTWQAIGSLSSDGAMMSMDLTGMCNINMMYFLIAVFVCLFISEDFRSGYAKNLFTVRAKKSDYVISKTLIGFVSGAAMVLAFFVGALIGGAVAGLSFETEAGTTEIFMCMLSKIFLVAAFSPIYVMMSVVGKQKVWLSLIGSLAVSMLFFMMIPMMAPLDSGITNIILCLAGGVLFSAGFGAISKQILNKTSLI